MFRNKRWLTLLGGFFVLAVVAVVYAFVTIFSVPGNLFDTAPAPSPVVTPASNIVSMAGMQPGDSVFGFATVTNGPTNGLPPFTYTITGVSASNGLTDVLTLSIFSGSGANGTEVQCESGDTNSFNGGEAYNGPILGTASNAVFSNNGSAGDIEQLCFVVTLPASATDIGGQSANVTFDFEATN